MTKKTCNICCSDKVEENFVSCPQCNFETCKKCLQTFLLSQNDIEPFCMNTECKKVFSSVFLYENLNNTFNNKHLREKNALIIIDREKSLLPQTQITLSIENELDELIKDTRRRRRSCGNK